MDSERLGYPYSLCLMGSQLELRSEFPNQWIVYKSCCCNGMMCLSENRGYGNEVYHILEWLFADKAILPSPTEKP